MTNNVVKCPRITKNHFKRNKNYKSLHSSSNFSMALFRDFKVCYFSVTAFCRAFALVRRVRSLFSSASKLYLIMSLFSVAIQDSVDSLLRFTSAISSKISFLFLSFFVFSHSTLLFTFHCCYISGVSTLATLN